MLAVQVVARVKRAARGGGRRGAVCGSGGGGRARRAGVAALAPRGARERAHSGGGGGAQGGRSGRGQAARRAHAGQPPLAAARLRGVCIASASLLPLPTTRRTFGSCAHYNLASLRVFAIQLYITVYAST